ncbi:MAG: HD-GYP domain-containing protein [Coriobacteriia bacterium]|nr:HD-GYP domain-containing protein [Coriobacteriia bacterium]
MQHVKAFVLRHFEVSVVVVLVLATAFAVLFADNRLAFLNFFYIPTLVAAYFLGRKQGVLVAVVGVLMVWVYAIPDPTRFGESAEQALVSLFLWGAFVIVTAFVVGTLYEFKKSAVDDLRQAYQGILAILAKFIDAVDSYTQEHSMRVSGLAAKIAERMGLPESDIESVRVAGLLHDIGKIDVSLDVLRKASVLDDSEWAQVRTHPTKGTALLQPVGGLLSDVVPLVECHHECFDGSGYLGKKGAEIPLGARILAVADSYDAMVCDRPYRTGRTPAEALKEVERCSGTQFDPTVVDAFKSVMHLELEYA